MTDSRYLTFVKNLERGYEKTVKLKNDVVICNNTEGTKEGMKNITNAIWCQVNKEGAEYYHREPHNEVTELNLRWQGYDALEEITNLDTTDGKDTLTEKDLLLAKQLIGKHGITGVDFSGKDSGIFTIEFEDRVLRFDFKTDKEVKAEKDEEIRQQKEAEIAKKRNIIAKNMQAMQNSDRYDFEFDGEYITIIIKDGQESSYEDVVEDFNLKNCLEKKRDTYKTGDKIIMHYDQFNPKRSLMNRIGDGIGRFIDTVLDASGGM